MHHYNAYVLYIKTFSLNFFLVRIFFMYNALFKNVGLGNILYIFSLLIEVVHQKYKKFFWLEIVCI